MKKKLISKIFRIFGYSLVKSHRIEPIIFSQPLNKFIPQQINYLINHQSFIVELPLNRSRGLPRFCFSENSRHPYVNALRSSDTNISLEYIYEKLNFFFQNDNFQSYFNEIFKKESFRNVGPWQIPMPWQKENLEEWTLSMKAVFKNDSKRFGVNLTALDGWSWSGPVSENKLTVEAKRLYSIYNSIKKSGYITPKDLNNSIQVLILVDSHGSWTWQVQTGQHRMAVLSALSYERASVCVIGVVFKNDAEFWPNVSNGLYTKNEALTMFDKIFNNDF